MISPAVQNLDDDEALRRSTVLERVSEGVVALDTNLRYTYVNDRAEQILDADRAQLIGRHVWDAFPESEETAAEDALDLALATQEQQSFERYDPSLDRWFEVRVYPDESGLSLYFTDITDRKASEQALAQKNRQLNALIENTAQAVYVKDRAGRYQFVNEAAADLVGLPPEEAVGKRAEDLFDAESAAEIRRIDEQILADGTADSYEATRFIDGTKHVFLENRYPHRDEDGTIVGIVGISREITERKRREKTLEGSRQRLKSLFENLPDSVVIHDAEGHILDVNEQTVDELGYTYRELRSMNVADFEVGLSQEELRETWRTMEVGDRAKKSGRHRRKDGSSFPIEVWVDKTEIGGEKRFIALSRDVTEQLQKERKLKALTEEYHALLENAEDAIFFLDVEEEESGTEFRFERLNPYHEAATGLDSESVRGKTPREVLGPDLGAELEANYHRCVEAGAPISYQEELDMPAGPRIWQTKLAPVVVDGTVTRIVGIARDVTAQVHREEKLRRKNERLDEFAGIVAHDLRNPLNVAQMRTTLSVEDPDYEELHRRKVHEALDRMEDIISDTLVLARRGNEAESLEPVSVTDIAEQCWDMVETNAASLIVDDACTIEGDPDRLRHVFENLFRNAVEHSEGDVTVRVGRADDAVLYVEDDGPGVPPARRETAFEPGETSREQGTGFGLSIVKRIAEAHGWDVRLTESPDGGARFEFTGVEIRS
ncbi:PAS domain S-box-containing protein [Salinibacter ruber]|uniref:PAS domain-containing protein n=1 Tax=Salinibacter ruber TaxID=146919 RepID=UPI002168DAF5|nr:PAS domain-containing protein [Salinibacter ruber]MCS4193948.1 PAS domain S-box-containing protein [Salinibacter ruber]